MKKQTIVGKHAERSRSRKGGSAWPRLKIQADDPIESKVVSIQSLLGKHYFHESRLPDFSLMCHQHAAAFCPGALGLAKAILGRLDTRRLQWFIDPDGEQLLPQLRHMEHVTADAPVMTVLAYWRAKAAGIDL